MVVSVNITSRGLENAIVTLSKLSNFDTAELSDNLGALIESSTKRRLGVEKTSPDGKQWAAWSASYAKTRGNEHSLLVNDNDLLESIQNYSKKSEVKVGSHLEYAARRHFGGSEFGYSDPAREYLGLSDRDERDLLSLVRNELSEIFA